jgi:hypothetical protein
MNGLDWLSSRTRYKLGENWDRHLRDHRFSKVFVGSVGEVHDALGGRAISSSISSAISSAEGLGVTR